ncbi:hypothetical protein TNCV_3012731 [Trichonephila clavipes]|nr:hypothetical protein TNCV_3012731 [Trichonephila clavipes]
MSSNPVPVKTCRVEEPMHVKSVENSNVLPLVWCGRKERGVPAQVSSSSLDPGSKLRGPSPKALGQLNSATLMFTHALPTEGLRATTDLKCFNSSRWRVFNGPRLELVIRWPQARGHDH